MDIDKAAKLYPGFKQPLIKAVLKYQTVSSSLLKTLGFSKSQLEQFALINAIDNTTVSQNAVTFNGESLDLGSFSVRPLTIANAMKFVDTYQFIHGKLKPTYFSMW